MEILTPGEEYLLYNESGKQESYQLIHFTRKVLVPTIRGNQIKILKDGTSTEEVLNMIIDRLYFQQSRNSYRERAIAITNIEQAKMWLNKLENDISPQRGHSKT